MVHLPTCHAAQAGLCGGCLGPACRAEPSRTHLQNPPTAARRLCLCSAHQQPAHAAYQTYSDHPQTSFAKQLEELAWGDACLGVAAKSSLQMRSLTVSSLVMSSLTMSSLTMSTLTVSILTTCPHTLMQCIAFQGRAIVDRLCMTSSAHCKPWACSQQPCICRNNPYSRKRQSKCV